jgi:hypothetical protein
MPKWAGVVGKWEGNHTSPHTCHMVWWVSGREWFQKPFAPTIGSSSTCSFSTLEVKQSEISLPLHGMCLMESDTHVCSHHELVHLPHNKRSLQYMREYSHEQVRCDS